YRALQRDAASWGDIEVRHRGRSVVTHGHSFWAITRRQLLRVLQQRATDSGAELVFGRRVEALDQLGECDLVVGADGVNSLVRERFADVFRPAWRTARSNYIWLGATHGFPSFSFVFEATEAGAFGAHVYPIAPDLSTFVVDAETETLVRAGLDPTLTLPPGESDEASVRYLHDVFAAHLGGGRLVGNNSKWLRFRELRTASWHTGRHVLLGDAAHTAHPSVGSGTKLAMEDGVVLARVLAEHDDVDAALGAYERERRPAVERVQAAAEAGSRWWDWFGEQTSLPTEQFVFNYLTRTPRITRDELRTRDRRLVRAVDGWWAERHGDGGSRPAALEAPCRVGPLALANRIGVVCSLPAAAADAAGRELAAEAIVGAARWGAGLVVVDGAGLQLAEADLADLFAAAETVRAGTAGATALRLHAAALAPHTLELLRGSCVDCLVVAASAAADDVHLDAVRRASELTPCVVGAELRLTADDAAEPARALERASRLAQEGAAFLAASFDDTTGDERRTAAQHLAGLLRIRAGLPLVLFGAVADDDEASTAVLAARADVCCGEPRLGQRAWADPQLG
ncbi:MAG TPA: FAD-dependent monooxygenase, partial [Conexibacter sp.]|nr:FAD-dependent monooxygenase [Conexibacter sp.]